MTMIALELRPYNSEDLPAILNLFYNTVHTVNARHYTPEQLSAWADGRPDALVWDTSLRAHHSLVAWLDGIIVGFGDMDETGYLDRLYVHADHLGQGIATALCDALEGASAASSFTTHASITARPFFERRGYRVVQEQQVERHGVLLTNYVMEKRGSFPS